MKKAQRQELEAQLEALKKAADKARDRARTERTQEAREAWKTAWEAADEVAAKLNPPKTRGSASRAGQRQTAERRAQTEARATDRRWK